MNAELVTVFQLFCFLIGNDKHMMTIKASNKLVADCWDSEFHEYGIKSIVEASTFPACIEIGTQKMKVNKENVNNYISKTAFEIAKVKTNNTILDETDAIVISVQQELVDKLHSCKPVLNQ